MRKLKNKKEVPLDYNETYVRSNIKTKNLVGSYPHFSNSEDLGTDPDTEVILPRANEDDTLSTKTHQNS